MTQTRAQLIGLRDDLQKVQHDLTFTLKSVNAAISAYDRADPDPPTEEQNLLEIVHAQLLGQKVISDTLMELGLTSDTADKVSSTMIARMAQLERPVLLCHPEEMVSA